jgi:hypothetical protein
MTSHISQTNIAYYSAQNIDQWSQALFESKQLSPSHVDNSVDNSK